MVGLTQGRAVVALMRAGLRRGPIEKKKVKGKKHRVVEQSPAAGTRAPKGTKVKLVIGR